jgi:hypothetical protein
MNVFITYNYKTGWHIAKATASALEDLGLDPWWFPGPADAEQIDLMVTAAAENCRVCVVVWSSPHVSDWQLAEIMGLWHRLAPAWPGSDPTDAFVVLRNISHSQIKERRTLPFLAHSEYLDYGANGNDTLPDLGRLRDWHPGTQFLSCESGRAPEFAEGALRTTPNVGRHVLIGRFTERSVGPRSGWKCWIVFEDLHNNVYVQQPRPTVTHPGRWIATNVYIGRGIKAVTLRACGPGAHRFLKERTLLGEFGGIPHGEFPKDYVDVDRRDFSPTA